MKSEKRLILRAMLGMLLFALSSAYAQTDVEESLLEEAENADDLLEKLEKWREHPIDLNQASLHELQELPVISPILAKAVIAERDKNGAFRSLSDARKRIGWDSNTWERIEPFLTVLSSPVSNRRFLRMRERHTTRFPKASGYTDGSYGGNPWKIYRRLTVHHSDRLRGGMLIEKDAGERDRYDHIVGYVETNVPSLGIRAVAGHYRLEFGQGLVFWGPYGGTKGADPIATAKKKASGVRGYAFADENHFFTGLVFTLQRKGLRITGLASRTPLDAALLSDGSAQNLIETGLHRTDLERSKKNRVTEALIGGRIQLSGALGSAGITGRFGRYSRSLSPGDPERSFFAFQGTHNHVLGVDADIILGAVNLSGEAAVSRSGGWAAQLSTVARVNAFDLALLIRRYGPDFQNPHSRGFGSDTAQNEWGVYFGLRGRITPSSTLSIYYDLFRRPWRTYTLPVPTGGSDLFAQLEHRVSVVTWLLRARFRQTEEMQTGLSDWHSAEILAVRRHWQYRCECRFRPSPGIDIRSRIEAVRVTVPEIIGEIRSSSIVENGLLLYHDVRIRPESDLTLALRWITFDTPSYDSRIYEFESDLPGVLSLRPLYGRGFRWYVLLKWHFPRWLRLSVKYGATRRENIEAWGTGHDEIPGDTVRELGFQAEVVL